MNPIYRHILTIGTDDYVVHPVYKDDMALDYALESQQLFYRAELSGKMDFVGEDASLIIGQPFTTEYVLTIQSSSDFGLTWSNFHVSKFYQTDCTISLDDLKVTVKPAVKDRYQKVLDGLEKEYNLIELLPVIEPIKLTRRGIIQIYGRGDSVITNIYTGISWEQDFDLQGAEPTGSPFHFAKIANRVTMTFNNPPAGLEGVFSGTEASNGLFRLDNGLGEYYIIREWYGAGYVTNINRISNNETIWENHGDRGYSLEFDYYDDHTQHIYSSGYSTDIYCRLVCDVPQVTYGGETKDTYWMASNDPMYGGNYHYCIGYDTPNVVQSNRTSTTPTQWGRKNENEYYNTPDDNNYYIPIAQSLWGEYSFWFCEDDSDRRLEESSRKQFTLKDAYPLWSVIQVLLTKNETGVTFQGTSDYSHFFYDAANPVTLAYTRYPYITPKSNILKGDYKDPAMKAPITLATVFDLLKKAFGCYWWIDDQMKLHVEHISYFKNGGTYTGTHQIGVDLTTLLEPTNKKPWSFGTNSYQFDKIQMPARYQYSWMDDGTEIFDGNAVDIVNDFVQTDKVEDINIGNFSSDIDYMQIAPENISKDGFALLMAVENDETGEMYVQFTQLYHYRMMYVQNYYASLEYLILNYLVSDLPSWEYKYGDITYPYLAYGIQRGKKQTVQIPLGDTIPDMMKLVRTGLGDGQIEKMSINLSSRVAKTTLKYDTYDEP